MTAILKTALLALCWVLLFASGSLRAELVPVPALKQRVTDLTQTLSPEQQSALEAKLAEFEQQKGSQIAVLIVPTTAPEAIEQYSIRVVDAWKLGRAKQDDGVLLLVVKNDRKMRIEVGYGLEGAIPDIYAKRIISEIMVPAFRQGDFYGGINNALDQIIRLISGEQLPAPVKSKPIKSKLNDDSLMDMFYLALIAAFVVGGMLRAIFGKFMGGILNGGIIGVLIWLFGGAVLIAIVVGIIAFFLTFAGASGLGHAGGMGGGYRGGYGGGHGGFGGWSGGGGGFGGGGASGHW